MISVSVTESRFTPLEVARLLASRRAEKAPRGSHGVLISDATDPKNKDAFTVPLPITDFAGKALRKTQDAYEKRWGKEAMHDTLWRVEMKD
ncbi:hypothetical protein [Microbacterium sp. Leaf320]|uniref:hypothetical protein n=1 Tax=Microbacterium sp. Leaf320 TaxID=1736334 RepID=UPI0012FB6C4E|nr:hypothetical protein [Microbacterium sp. Leaf320]